MLFTQEGVEEALAALVSELLADGAEATISVVGGGRGGATVDTRW